MGTNQEERQPPDLEKPHERQALGGLLGGPTGPAPNRDSVPFKQSIQVCHLSNLPKMTNPQTDRRPPFPVWFERAYWPGMEEVRGKGIQVLSPGDSRDPYHGVEEAVAIVAGVLWYDREVMDRAPKLTVIARTGIGYDGVDLSDATRRSVYVCNVPDGPTIPTAEHAIALMLAAAKRLPAIQHHLRQGDRAGIRAHSAVELSGKVLGLVGFGRIARRVAAAGAALGMQVTSYDPYLTDDQFGSVDRSTELDAMLTTADVVSIHIPLTEESRRMFDHKALSGMKRGAILINTARGGLVDTDALIQAVTSGHLGAVGLDVTDPEPLPADSPLLHLENVLVTPHVASWTHEAKRRMLLGAVDRVLEALSGHRPSNLVNPQVLHRMKPQPQPFLEDSA